MENLIKKTCLSQFTLIYFLLILSSDMLQENFLYYIIPKYCIAFFFIIVFYEKPKSDLFLRKRYQSRFFFCIFYHAIFLTRPRTVFLFSILNYKSTYKALAEWNINCNSMYVDTFDRKIKVGS